MYEHSTTIPLIGLDIGKNVHVLGIYQSDDLSPMREPLEVYNNRDGLEQVCRQIDWALIQYGQAKLGNEPTGIYHETWTRALLERYARPIAEERLDYRLLNPHLVKLSRTELQGGRHRKSDNIDSQAMARCLQLGQGSPARLIERMSTEPSQQMRVTMTKTIQVITTTATKTDAQKIARALLGARLAGCVQIIGPITSAYWWEGKIEEAEEYLCLIKSRADLFEQLEAAIRAAHPYDVPEVLAVPVVAGSRDYLDWLNGELITA